jgi:hypothetical protein
MSKMNVEPMITFSDGSQLLVSTRYTGEGQFICELFLLDPHPKSSDGKGLRAVTNGMEAPTCRQAQDIACGQARRLFPDNAPRIKEPPYLVWSGPNIPLAPQNRGRRPMA